ncbi:MAG TPA: DEAD/DEAH box helicase [Chloroflexota bacterium]|nr:DEAD/DEAH box helicase [Chloroflexota bacterium]
MSTNPWFREHDPDQPPRWLGLIPRQPRLTPGQAARTTVSEPVTGDPHRLRVGRIEIGPGRSMLLGAVREEQRHRGSVHVAGLEIFDPLLETLRETPRWQREGTDEGAGGIWQPSAAGAPNPEKSLARMLAAVLQPPLELLLGGEGPIEWPHPLLGYQLDGVRALLERPALLLADDMGLGKTIQAIAALRILIHQRRVGAALAVVPAGLIAQWRSELAQWAPELRVSTVYGEPNDRAWRWRAPAHLYLTSYETLRADFTGNPHAPPARQWDLVILDEAQRIKNADTDTSRVTKRLRRTRSWALTGTPLENSLDDLASILQWVEREPPRASWHLVSPAEMRDRLGRVQLRRRKADVLADLPPKLAAGIVLALTPPQRAAYDRAEQEGLVELHALGDRIRVRNVLELIVRLKQICNFDPLTGRSSKLDDLRERVRTLIAQGHRALVFTQFANQRDGARAIAARLDVPALSYTGDLSQGERERVLAQFRQSDQYKVLVLALRAGGQGLNLQQASYVFHFDRWWNPAVEQQAESRSHRMGQIHPVHVYAYSCEDTIEERIEKILQEKQALFDAVVEDATIDLGARLSGDELFGLFGLRGLGGS